MTDEYVQMREGADEEIVMSVSRPRPGRKGRAWSVIGSILLVIVITVSVVGAYGWRDSLSVKRVFVEGNRIIPARDIVYRAKVKFSMSLYEIDLDMVRENILSLRYIKSVDVVRELPDALRITVQERLPIAAIVNERVMFLDEQGMMLPLYEGAMVDVPFIRGEKYVDDPKRVQVTDARVLQALDFLKHARFLDAVGNEAYHLISEVHVAPNGDLVLYSSDAGVKILLGKVDSINKLHLLKTFWDLFVHQRGADRLRLLDLRFEDQIIARWDDNEQHNRVRK